MLTLYHSPNSRSTSVLVLLHELGAVDQVKIERVTIPRNDGTGQSDERNPHPEKKVPYLTDGDDFVRERGAIFAYLTDRFPKAGLAPQVGEALRGQYLSWLGWYQGVLEPVMILRALGIEHPGLASTFRGYDEMAARLSEALQGNPYLLGKNYSAADLLCSSPFAWFPAFTPEDPKIQDWVARCKDRESVRWAGAQDNPPA